MRYLSVCSGIEAASVAWHDFGWTLVGFAEIDKGPSKVLAHHYGSNMPGEPVTSNGVPNFGDFTKIPLDTLGPVDLLVGGTPCQAFSVAGKRLSLDDARGNLTLAYVVLAHELARSHGLKCALWENVPGVLSTKDNAFGCFLGALSGGDDPLHLPKGIERWPDAGLVAGPRARVAWRLLDAQYFGLAQRRRRVFVVASFGDGPDPAAVLFERQGVRRHPPARGEARENLAPTISARTRGGGGLGTDAELDGGLITAQAPTLDVDENGLQRTVGTLCADTHPGAYSGQDAYTGRLVPHCVTGEVTHTLKAEGFDASEDGTGRGQPIVTTYAIQAGALRTNPNSGPDGVGVQADHAYTLEARAEVQAVAFSCKDHGADATNELAPTMRAMGHAGSHANAGGQLAVAFDTTQITHPDNRSNPKPGDPCHPLAAGAHAPAVAYDLRGREGGAQFEGPHETANIRAASGGSSRSYVAAMAVRRLTPVECERLQGFPDNHTAILKADGPRYKALGNSMAVSVMRWIGERIRAAS